MKELIFLAAKDLRVLSRDRFALFWIFAFPLMFALFFGAIFGDSSGGGSRSRVQLVIVDEARSEASARLIQALAEHESVRLVREESTAAEEESGLAPVRIDSLEQARAAVRRGDALAYLRIREGFEASPFALFGGGPEDVDDAAALEVGIDPSRTAEAGFLQGILMETVFGGLEDSTDADGEARGGLMNLVTTVDVTRDEGRHPRSAFEITFPSSMMWGLMSVALGFAVTLVRERTHGTLLRLRIAPISRGQLLGGKALACFAACLFVLFFLTAFGMLALGIRVESPFLALLAMVCTSFCFTGLMMTVAVLGRTEEAVAGASWGLMMPFAMIGGGMIPLIAMPPWLARLSHFSFFKWGILSLEGAIWRGFTATDMLMPCGILIGIGLVFFAIGLSVFRRTVG